RRVALSQSQLASRAGPRQLARPRDVGDIAASDNAPDPALPSASAFWTFPVLRGQQTSTKVSRPRSKVPLSSARQSLRANARCIAANDEIPRLFEELIDANVG